MIFHTYDKSQICLACTFQFNSIIRNSKTKHERVKRRTYDQPSQPLHFEQDLSEAMDGIMNDRIDYDYYVEEDSDAEFSEAEHR